MGKISLKEYFCSGKEELENSLSGLSLPKDSKKIQIIVSDYFSNLFENDGAYRRSLTESEDYLLISVIQVLKSQQSIIEEIAAISKPTSLENERNSNQKESINPYIALVGTGVGALVGSLAGVWAASAGSIAGTALGIYYSTHKFKEPKNADNRVADNQIEDSFDVKTFVDIVEKLCDNIDYMLDTFRTQIQRLKNAYDNKQEENFLHSYNMMAEKMGLLLSVIHTHEEGLPPKILQAATMLEDCLENYSLKYENGKIINI